MGHIAKDSRSQVKAVEDDDNKEIEWAAALVDQEIDDLNAAEEEEIRGEEFRFLE